jgi:hypothetical protein
MHKKHHSKGRFVLGLAALTAAGAYFLFGTKAGAKKRKEMRSWAFKMKGEVLERVEDAREITEEKYNTIIDEVRAHYAGIKNIDRTELDEVVDDLKIHWENVKENFLQGRDKARKE